MTPPSTPIAEPGAAIGYAGPLRRLGRRMRDGRTVPVLTVVLAILAIWYLAAIGMNWAIETVKLERTGDAYGVPDTVAATWSAETPPASIRRVS